MKNIFVVMGVALIFTGQAQDIQKHLVVFEKFSGVYCGACTEAVHNIHDMIDNDNAQIATISYQSAGGYSIPLYENDDSDGRHSYYSSSISGYPTVIAEGNENPTWNDYNDYLAKYTAAYNEMTPIDISANFSENGNGNLTINSTITKVAGSSSVGSNLKIRIAITETNIDQVWMNGETHLYNVNRKMLPTHSGTSVNFSAGDIQNVSESFEIDEAWDRDYLSAIVFVQDEDDKSILQAFKISLADSDLSTDAMVDNIYGDDSYCGTSLAPKIRIRNSGTTVLTSATIEYSVGQTTGTYNWTGSLNSYEQADIDLPALTFTASEGVFIDAKITSPNGGTDQDLSNDRLYKLVTHGLVIGSTPKLEVQTDYFAPSYSSWDLYDANNTSIESEDGSGWVSFNNYITNFNLTDGCYTFVIRDDTENGFVDYTIGSGQSNAGQPEGYYKFYDENDNIITENVNFGAEEKTFFGVGITVLAGHYGVDGIANIGLEESTETSMTIYPNPVDNEFNLQLPMNGEFTIEVINAQGQIVLTATTSSTNTLIDASSLTNGVYIVKAYNDLNNYNLKIIK